MVVDGWAEREGFDCGPKVNGDVSDRVEQEPVSVEAASHIHGMHKCLSMCCQLPK